MALLVFFLSFLLFFSSSLCSLDTSNLIPHLFTVIRPPPPLSFSFLFLFTLLLSSPFLPSSIRLHFLLILSPPPPSSSLFCLSSTHSFVATRRLSTIASRLS